MSYPFRLTNKAIRILDLHSVEEAKRLNHDMLTPEHVLLGIFHETDSIVVNVLNKLKIDIEKIKFDIESSMVKSTSNTKLFGKIPLSTRIYHLISRAAEEAKSLGDNCISTEHLLLGILKEENGIAYNVLTSYNLDLKTLRQEMMRIRRYNTDKATIRILDLHSVEEAKRLNHDMLTPEHVLLGIFHETDSIVVNVLNKLKIDIEKIKFDIESSMTKSTSNTKLFGKIPLSTRIQHLISRAAEEAKSLGDNCISTEHLLLGILKEENGIAYNVLISYNLDLKTLRQEMMRIRRYNTEKEYEIGYLQEKIYTASSKLKGKQRDVFILRYYENYSVMEP